MNDEINRVVNEAYKVLTLSSLTSDELREALARLTQMISSIPTKEVKS